MVFDVDEITEGGLGFDLTVAHDKFKIDHTDCRLKNDVRIHANLSRLNQEVYLKDLLQEPVSHQISQELPLNALLFQ